MRLLLIAFLSIASVIADSAENARFRSQRGRNTTTCDCGWSKQTKSRIVGGSNAAVGEFPYAVYITILRFDNGTHWLVSRCTGSIINHKQILTAAHCVTFYNSVQNTRDVFHPDNITITYNTIDVEDANGRYANASLIAVHPDYNNGDNDIALITISSTFKFRPDGKLGPVCLPKDTDFMPLNETDVIAAGWGLTSEPNSTYSTISNVLQKVHLTRNFDINDCNQKWSDQLNATSEHILQKYGEKPAFDLNRFANANPEPICTDDDIGRSTCRGDSGGPLVWYNSELNKYVLVGVTSFGPNAVRDVPGCFGPSGYTDVRHFYNWILQNLASAEKICTRH